jgi:hypothetical protein
MAGEEAGQGLGHGPGTPEVQQVGRAGEHERLGLVQPGLHQGLALGPDR